MVDYDRRIGGGAMAAARGGGRVMRGQESIVASCEEWTKGKDDLLPV